MKIRLALVLALFLASSASCSLVRPSPDPYQRLVDAHRRLVSGAQSVKPSIAEKMMAQANEMEKLIEETKAGKPLDVAESDRLVERSYQPIY